MSDDYSYLNALPPHTRPAIKRLMDRLGQLERQIQAQGTVTEPLVDHLDANTKQVKNLKDPADNQDAVTLQYLRKYVGSVVANLPEPAPAAGTTFENATQYAGTGTAGRQVLVLDSSGRVAVLFSDEALTVAVTNPMTLDSTGAYSFYGPFSASLVELLDPAKSYLLLES